jgi:hypothetical protein
MAIQLDHVFVCTNADGFEAGQLVAAGLTEGRSGVHAGQGTANRCFLFHNAYLELIWVHDADEAASPLTRPTRLLERWTGRTQSTCPFGLCVRPLQPSTDGACPFTAWEYLPRYVPSGRPIHIGTNCDRLAEPMLFFLPHASAPDSWPGQPPLQHRLGVRQMTHLVWTRPVAAALSPELQVVVDAGLLGVELGDQHALTISFDHEAAGQSTRLLPPLPLALKW